MRNLGGGSGTLILQTCRAHLTSASSTINAGTDQAVGFDAEDADTNNFHDPASNNDRFYAQADGTYRFTARVRLGVTATTQVEFWLVKTPAVGSDTVKHGYAQLQLPNVGYDVTTIVVDEIAMLAGDYVVLHVKPTTNNVTLKGGDLEKTTIIVDQVGTATGGGGGGGGGSGDPSTSRQMLSADLTLTSSDARKLYLDPNGASRVVTLPTGAADLYFVIRNIGTAKKLVVRDAGGGLVAVVPPNFENTVTHDGTAWQGPYNNSLTTGDQMLLWFKADAGTYSDTGGSTPATVDGTAVAAWKDQKSGSKLVTQATSGNRPVLKTAIINGLPVVRFDGSDDHLDSTWISKIPASVTVLAVVARTWTSSSGVWPTVCATPSGGTFAFYAGNNVQKVVLTHGSYDDSTGNGAKVKKTQAFSNGTPHVLSGHIGKTCKLAFDGAVQDPDLLVCGEQSSAAANSIFAVGYDGGIGDYMSGDVAELMILNDELPDDARGYLEQLLGDKYAITIS